jgi:predicted Zn-dependent peptidase
MKKIVLENEIPCYVKELPTNTIGFAFVVNIGSAFEEKEKRGISHLLEHMLFKSNEKYSAEEITKGIELLGAKVNAFTGRNKTAYYFEVIKENFEKALDIFSSMYGVKEFKENEFNSEKQVVLSELKIYNEEPSLVIQELEKQSLFYGGDWGEDIGGYLKTVSNITKKDLEEFKENYYQPDNTYLLLFGNVSQKEINLVKEKFGKFEGKSKKKKEPSLGIKKEIFKEKTFFSKFRKNAYFSLATRLKKDFKLEDLWVLDLLFKGGMSSPLFQELREKRGFAYHISFDIEVFDKKGIGDLSVIFHSINQNNIEKAEEITIDLFKKLKNKKFSKKFREGRIYFKKLLLSELEKDVLGLVEIYSNYLSAGFEIDVLERRKKFLDNFEKHFNNFEFPFEENFTKVIYKP